MSSSPRIARSVRTALDTLKSATKKAYDETEDFQMDDYLLLVSNFLQTAEAQFIKYAAKIDLLRSAQDELHEEIGRLGEFETDLKTERRKWQAERHNFESEKDDLQLRVEELENELSKIKSAANDDLLEVEPEIRVLKRRVTWADQLPALEQLVDLDLNSEIKRDPKVGRSQSLPDMRSPTSSNESFDAFQKKRQPNPEDKSTNESELDESETTSTQEVDGNVTAEAGALDAGGESIPKTLELYIITYRVAITDGIELTTNRLGHLEVGKQIEITETIETGDRLRGHVLKPSGWISIRSTCSRRWVWAKRLETRWPS